MRIKVCDGAPGCGTFFRDGGDGVALILGTLDQPPPARSATVADALAWYKETKGDAVTSVYATPEAARDALRSLLHDPKKRTTLALRDSFSGWERSGATARGGKPLFVEVGDVRVHQIFFDDHILEDAIMFTIVYILYAENLDWPTAGTRVKDADGTSASLPCVAGEANVIRSGESDGDAFLHSGPLKLGKLDPNKPAYRMMMQSKVVVRPKGGRRRPIPSRGTWRGLGISGVPADDGDVAAWLAETSRKLTAGVGESNAVGFEAYPINVRRGVADRVREISKPSRFVGRTSLEGDGGPLRLRGLPGRRAPARARRPGHARGRFRLRPALHGGRRRRALRVVVPRAQRRV